MQSPNEGQNKAVSQTSNPSPKKSKEGPIIVDSREEIAENFLAKGAQFIELRKELDLWNPLSEGRSDLDQILKKANSLFDEMYNDYCQLVVSNEYDTEDLDKNLQQGSASLYRIDRLIFSIENVLDLKLKVTGFLNEDFLSGLNNFEDIKNQKKIVKKQIDLQCFMAIIKINLKNITYLPRVVEFYNFLLRELQKYEEKINKLEEQENLIDFRKSKYDLYNEINDQCDNIFAKLENYQKKLDEYQLPIQNAQKELIEIRGDYGSLYDQLCEMILCLRFLNLPEFNNAIENLTHRSAEKGSIKIYEQVAALLEAQSFIEKCEIIIKDFSHYKSDFFPTKTRSSHPQENKKYRDLQLKLQGAVFLGSSVLKSSMLDEKTRRCVEKIDQDIKDIGLELVSLRLGWEIKKIPYPKKTDHFKKELAAQPSNLSGETFVNDNNSQRFEDGTEAFENVIEISFSGHSKEDAVLLDLLAKKLEPFQENSNQNLPNANKRVLKITRNEKSKNKSHQKSEQKTNDHQEPFNTAKSGEQISVKKSPPLGSTLQEQNLIEKSYERLKNTYEDIKKAFIGIQNWDIKLKNTNDLENVIARVNALQDLTEEDKKIIELANDNRCLPNSVAEAYAMGWIQDRCNNIASMMKNLKPFLSFIRINTLLRVPLQKFIDSIITSDGYSFENRVISPEELIQIKIDVDYYLNQISSYGQHCSSDFEKLQNYFKETIEKLETINKAIPYIDSSEKVINAGSVILQKSIIRYNEIVFRLTQFNKTLSQCKLPAKSDEDNLCTTAKQYEELHLELVKLNAQIGNFQIKKVKDDYNFKESSYVEEDYDVIYIKVSSLLRGITLFETVEKIKQQYEDYKNEFFSAESTAVNPVLEKKFNSVLEKRFYLDLSRQINDALSGNKSLLLNIAYNKNCYENVKSCFKTIESLSKDLSKLHQYVELTSIEGPEKSKKKKKKNKRGKDQSKPSGYVENLNKTDEISPNGNSDSNVENDKNGVSSVGNSDSNAENDNALLSVPEENLKTDAMSESALEKPMQSEEQIDSSSSGKSASDDDQDSNLSDISDSMSTQEIAVTESLDMFMFEEDDTSIKFTEVTKKRHEKKLKAVEPVHSKEKKSKVTPAKSTQIAVKKTSSYGQLHKTFIQKTEIQPKVEITTENKTQKIEPAQDKLLNLSTKPMENVKNSSQAKIQVPTKQADKPKSAWGKPLSVLAPKTTSEKENADTKKAETSNTATEIKQVPENSSRAMKIEEKAHSNSVYTQPNKTFNHTNTKGNSDAKITSENKIQTQKVESVKHPSSSLAVKPKNNTSANSSQNKEASVSIKQSSQGKKPSAWEKPLPVLAPKTVSEKGNEDTKKTETSNAAPEIKQVPENSNITVKAEEKTFKNPENSNNIAEVKEKASENLNSAETLSPSYAAMENFLGKTLPFGSGKNIQTIKKGSIVYTPARFEQFLDGKKVEVNTLVPVDASWPFYLVDSRASTTNNGTLVIPAPVLSPYPPIASRSQPGFFNQINPQNLQIQTQSSAPLQAQSDKDMKK